MFISRTTREERVTIETVLDGAFQKIDQAEQLIYDLIDAFLSDREQKTLDRHAAQTIRNNLWIADDLLADAQLEYHLHNKGLLLWAAASLCFVNVIKENNYAAGDSYQPH